MSSTRPEAPPPVAEPSTGLSMAPQVLEVTLVQIALQVEGFSQNLIQQNDEMHWYFQDVMVLLTGIYKHL